MRLLLAEDAIEADRYLVKQFAFWELQARVRALSGRSRTFESDTFGLGDLRASLPRHRVERAGRRIDLAAEECALFVPMLRSELRARDIEEIDSKTHAVPRPIAEARDARGIERSLPRFVDTPVGRQHLCLGAWAPGSAAADRLPAAAGSRFRAPGARR